MLSTQVSSILPIFRTDLVQSTLPSGVSGIRITVGEVIIVLTCTNHTKSMHHSRVLQSHKNSFLKELGCPTQLPLWFVRDILFQKRTGRADYFSLVVFPCHPVQGLASSNGLQFSVLLLTVNWKQVASIAVIDQTTWKVGKINISCSKCELSMCYTSCSKCTFLLLTAEERFLPRME